MAAFGYLALRFFNIRPGEFAAMPQREKAFIMGCINKRLEEEEAEA